MIGVIKNSEGFAISTVSKLTSQPATVLWVLAEDMRFLLRDKGLYCGTASSMISGLRWFPCSLSPMRAMQKEGNSVFDGIFDILI